MNRLDLIFYLFGLFSIAYLLYDHSERDKAREEQMKKMKTIINEHHLFNDDEAKMINDSIVKHLDSLHLIH